MKKPTTKLLTNMWLAYLEGPKNFQNFADPYIELQHQHQVKRIMYDIDCVPTKTIQQLQGEFIQRYREAVYG